MFNHWSLERILHSDHSTNPSPDVAPRNRIFPISDEYRSRRLDGLRGSHGMMPIAMEPEWIYAISSRYAPGSRNIRTIHPSFELAYSVRGSGAMEWGPDGNPVAMPKGHLLLLPPGTLHRECGGMETWQVLYLGFHAPKRMTASKIPACLAADGPMRFYLARILEELSGSGKAPRATLAHLSALILIGFDRLVDAPKGRPDPIGEIVAEMKDQPSREISVEDLAVRFHLHPRYFASRFKKRTGLPPGHFLRALRLDLAKRMLLETDAGVQEIGQRVGYEDPFYFSRLFRKHVGLSPTEFRQQAGAGS